MDTWIIVTIAVSAAVFVVLLILLCLYLRKKARIRKADEEVKAKVSASASVLSGKFGGNDNIRSISASGSRVTVIVIDPLKVDKAGISQSLDNVMYMGNKVVFVIGTESQEFEKLLAENVGKKSDHA
jgi:phosphotransferase system IIB component